MHIIASDDGGILVIIDYEEIDTDLQNITRASIQDSRISNMQVKTGAILQHMRFLHNRVQGWKMRHAS